MMVALIALAISFQCLWAQYCDMNTWDKLDSVLLFFQAQNKAVCAGVACKAANQNLYSDLQKYYGRYFLCVYTDYRSTMERLWSHLELSGDEKRKIDNHIIKSALDRGTCNLAASFNSNEFLNIKRIIEEVFPEADKRVYYLPTKCFLDVARRRFTELSTELGNSNKVQRARSLISEVVGTSTDPLRVLENQIRDRFCDEDSLKYWVGKTFLWSMIKCNIVLSVRARNQKTNTVDGTSTDDVVADEESGTDDSNQSDCPGIDDSGIEDNTSDNTDNGDHDDDSGHSDNDNPSPPTNDGSGLKKYQIYMIMAMPFVLGAIVIPVYVYMFIRTHLKKVN